MMVSKWVLTWAVVGSVLATVILSSVAALLLGTTGLLTTEAAASTDIGMVPAEGLSIREAGTENFQCAVVLTAEGTVYKMDCYPRELATPDQASAPEATAETAETESP